MPTAQSFRSTKTYRNFPCAHRRWRHEGHCAHVHGYSRAFTFVFSCSERTDNGFVMDFGGLKAVKAWLTEHSTDCPVSELPRNRRLNQAE